MMRTKYFIIPLLFLFTGCYYDNAAILYPGLDTCTPVTNPVFSSDILPILNTKCNSCHSGSSPSGGIKLDTYAEVLKYVNNRSLMGSINQASGFSAMPKGGYKMPVCEIQKIQDWITAGSLNN